MPIARKYKFNFKTRKIVDEAGNEIGRTKKQPSVECELPVPDASEIVAIFHNENMVKEQAMLLEAIHGIVYEAARDQFDEIIDGFGDDHEKEVSAAMLNYEQLDLTYLANLPPSTRGGTALTEEDWKTFFDDYLTVMVKATGKEESRIKLHLEYFKRPTKIKGNKPVLAVLVEQLDVYMSQSANLEDTGIAATRVQAKFKRWHDEPEKKIEVDML